MTPTDPLPGAPGERAAVPVPEPAPNGSTGGEPLWTSEAGPPAPDAGVYPGEPSPPGLARPRPPHPGFWWALLWCLLFLMVTQVIPAIVVLVATVGLNLVTAPNAQQYLRELSTAQGGDALARQVVLPSLLMAQVLGIGFSVLALRVVAGRDWPRQVALRRPAAGHMLLTVLAFPALWILANGVYELTRRLLPGLSDLGLPGMEKMVQEFGTWPVGLAVLIIGAGPGLSEELWCRGFLGRGLVGRYGPVLGVLATSFYFGLLHVDPRQGTMAAVLGVALHYLYLTTRSLWAPILLHFLNNSLSMVAAHYAMGLEVIDQHPEEIPYWLHLAAGALVAAVAWALYRSRARLVAVGDAPAWQPPYPGVAYPPPGIGTAVVRPRPGAAPLAAVLLALAAFVAAVVAFASGLMAEAGV
jgi:membrane protease YdiL (CAAX protease family)